MSAVACGGRVWAVVRGLVVMVQRLVATLPLPPHFARRARARRCVHRFDHHCVWLNSCVGSANYVAFVTLLVSAAAMLAIEIALCIYIIVQFGLSQDAFAARVAAFFPAVSGGAYFGVTVGVLVLVLAAWALVLQLLFFHVYLSA